MVQFGKLDIPLLKDEGKSKNLENGMISTGEVKEFKRNTPILFIVCALIFIGIASRAIVSNYTGDNNYISVYLVFSTFSFVFLSATVPEKDEILPIINFAKPAGVLLCIVEFCFAMTSMFISAPKDVIPAIVTNIITSILLTYLCSHFRIFNYNPLKNNDKYIKSYEIFKSCDGIKIKESRSFSIILENTGTKILPFSGISIERLTISKTKRNFVQFRLPEQGAINPGQTITIVPEVEKKKSSLSALVVPGFCCFGIGTGEKISTTLSNGKRVIAQTEEYFVHIGNKMNSAKFDSITEVVHTEEGTKTLRVK